MQEQMVKIYRPTVHLQRSLRFQNAIRRSRPEKTYCVEINAVTCNAFSIV